MSTPVSTPAQSTSTQPLRVTIWNEFRHEKENPLVSKHYPQGIHAAIAAAFPAGEFVVKTATLDEPEHGLSDEVLAQTDVLVWWGHKAHGDVSDAVAEKVVQRVWDGMGFVALHSAHFCKPFKRLMGTSCDLKWREANDRERLWVVNPSHPIAQGVGEYIQLESEEMYGEHFDIPAPEELIFVSWFSGGEVFRSGCTWRRGSGKVFYFRPGHETYPTYHNEQVQRVIVNGVRWAAPSASAPRSFGNRQPLETLPEDLEAAHRSQEGFR